MTAEAGGWRRYAALSLAFVTASVVIYWPSLPGPFISDDITYVAMNPYVQRASLANVRAILDPFGDMALMSANWAPTHLLAHMLEWRLFGVDVAAYHLTNAVLHALVSVLLVALLAACGARWAVAAAAGAFFLVHPANVEAVAWISQLKTLLAMAFLLAALLLRRRWPALGAAAFTLGLLSKALAAIAVPTAWALERAAPGGSPGARRAIWVWAAVFAAFAGIEFAAFLYAHPWGSSAPRPLEVRLASSAAIGLRYLVMAATGRGVSTFHEPAPTESLLDPAAVAGVAAGVALAARLLWALVRRRPEAGWWVLAAGSFLPVAQVFPFLYPMADRYLYFILPGLLGGALFAGRDALARLPERRRRAVGGALALACAAACVHFATVSHARAGLWVSDARVMADAVRHYPEGSMAHYVRARGAARERDAARAAAELRLASSNKAFGFQHVRTDPTFDPVRGSSAFQAVYRELARAHIEESRGAERLTETDLLSVAQAQLVVEDAAGALATLDRAVALRGGFGGLAATLRRQARDMARRQAADAADEGAAGAAAPGVGEGP